MAFIPIAQGLAAIKGIKGVAGSGSGIDPALIQRLTRSRDVARKEFEQRGLSVDEQIAQAKEDELSLKTQLGQRRKFLDEAIQNRLSQSLAGISTRAGEQRAGIGQLAAQAGLGRSSFATEELTGATLAEQQATAEKRTQAESQFAQSLEQERGTIRNIEQQRRVNQQQQELREFAASQQRFNILDRSVLQAQIGAELDAARIGAEDKEAFAGLLGGLGGLAGRFAGGGA